MFIVYILCKNRKIFYRGCFCAFLAGQRSYLLIFIAVIFGFSFLYLGQTFFAGKKGVSGPFYIGPFYTGPFCAPIPQKTPAHTTPLQRGSIWHAAAPKGPNTKVPEGRGAPQRPHAKTPGVIPRVWLMKSSFNLLLTHCGRFLAGCTGPACSRRPQ